MAGSTSLSLDAVRRVRVGTSLGFTLYAQFGASPTKQDPYLGVFNTAQLASYAVRAINDGEVDADLPWVSIGRLVYPGPGVTHLDDFIAVMGSPAIACWLANAVASVPPVKGRRHG